MFDVGFDLVSVVVNAVRAVMRDPVLAFSSAAVILALSSVLLGLTAGVALARRQRTQRARALREARRAELAFMRLSQADREKLQTERREREQGDRRERAGGRARDRRPRPSLVPTTASPRIRHHIALIEHRTQALLEMVEQLDGASAADVKIRAKRLHTHVSGLLQIADGQAEWSA
jgi:hypothetical protein